MPISQTVTHPSKLGSVLATKVGFQPASVMIIRVASAGALSDFLTTNSPKGKWMLISSLVVLEDARDVDLAISSNLEFTEIADQ